MNELMQANEENKQNIEGDGRNNEKIHCRNYISMILQKIHPGLLSFLIWFYGPERF